VFCAIDNGHFLQKIGIIFIKWCKNDKVFLIKLENNIKNFPFIIADVEFFSILFLGAKID
jgi:hypothetical protein